MSWTWKSTLLGGALAIIFLTVFAVQVKRVTTQSQETQWRDSALRQSALVERLILERAQSLKSSFPFASLQGGSVGEAFQLVVDMELSPEGDLRVRDLRRTEDWTLGREETASLLSLLKQRDYKPGHVYWFVRESEGAPHHMMAFLGEPGGQGFPQQASARRLWAAVLKSNPFERLADDFKGTAVELTLQDSLGQLLLDTRTASWTEEPTQVTGWSLQKNGAGVYRSGVPGTNLTLSYRVGPQALAFGSSDLNQTMIRLGLGVVLLGSGLLFWWLRRSPHLQASVQHTSAAPVLQTELKPQEEQAEAQVVEVPGPVVRPTSQQIEAFADELHRHVWGLLGPIHQLKEAGLMPSHQNLVLQMEEHVRPLLATSDSLRNYLKKEELPIETLDLAEEIRAVLASHRDAWQEADITVVEELEEGCWVRGSSFAIRKSLNEIIRNAMDALEGAHPKILEFSLAKLEGDIRLRVADSGRGLEGTIQPLAFEPFVGTKPGRMGLGLSYVYGVVQQMNGTAVFDARPSGGAQVLITFKATEAPLAKPLETESEKEAVVPESSVEAFDESLVTDTSVAAADKAPLYEDLPAHPLSEDESWGLTTLDDEINLSVTDQKGEVKGLDWELIDDEEDEDWSPVFSQISTPAPPQIKVRSPRRRDIQA